MKPANLRLASTFVTTAPIAVALATGCYVNDGAMCAWYWADPDRHLCPDVFVEDNEPTPINAAYGSFEGLSDTVLQDCNVTVRQSIWNAELQTCILLSAWPGTAHYDLAVGEECP